MRGGRMASVALLVVGLVSACDHDWTIGPGSASSTSGGTSDGGTSGALPPEQICSGTCACEANDSCNFVCPTGRPCTLACHGNTSCRLACAAGNQCKLACDDNAMCDLECAAGAQCDLTCKANAGCHGSCATGSQCTKSCESDCPLRCAFGSDCP